MFPTSVRWLLILPPWLPAALYPAAFAGSFDMTLSERYDGIAMTILFFALLPAAVAVEFMALRKAFPILIKNPDTRTIGNLICVAFGVAFVALAIVIVLLVD